VGIISTLGRLVFGDKGSVDWQRLGEHCHLREMIAQIIPGFAKMADLDRTRAEFTIAGRTFHTPAFPTPSGKARIHVHPLPRIEDGAGRLRLMTVRSEGQFNTVVYEEEDVYRGQDRRDVILMNGADIERLGLRVDQPVAVRSEAGWLGGIRVRAFAIRAGNALMYFPEANVLVPATTDPASKTPAFKCTWVTVEPETPATRRRPLEVVLAGEEG
jgi:anaerobic selenocysteine-containing dehydrogenase